MNRGPGSTPWPVRQKPYVARHSSRDRLISAAPRFSHCLLLLMDGAEVRRSSTDHRAAQRSAASRARLAFLAVGDEEDAAPADSVAQHAAQVVEERLHVAVRQTIGTAARMDSRPEQRLVRIEVADAGDELLRQQQRLDRAATSGDARAKLAQPDGQRI